jgi:hypothetical protein
VTDPAAAQTLDRPAALGGLEEPIDPRIFYPFLAVGGLCILWGLKQLIDRKVPLLPFGEWFVGAAILHDAVLAPAVIVIGWLLQRGAPRRLRAPVAAGLVVAGGILLYSIPALLGDGAEAADPSKLPNDEPRNVALVLVAVALVTAAVVALRRAPADPVAAPVAAGVVPPRATVASGPIVRRGPVAPSGPSGGVRAVAAAGGGRRRVVLVLLALVVVAVADALATRRRG